MLEPFAPENEVMFGTTVTPIGADTGLVPVASALVAVKLCAPFEKQMVENNIILVKFWLEVSNKEQERRFRARIDDPLRQWKLSNMDLPSRAKWYQYSKARDAMFKASDTRFAPWNIVRSDDKKRARLNTISHLLKLIPYKKVHRPKVRLPERSKKHAYDDVASIARRKFVPEIY